MGDLLVDVDLLGSLGGTPYEDTVTALGLALESEKKVTQLSKDKGLTATVLRLAQTAEQASCRCRWHCCW